MEVSTGIDAVKSRISAMVHRKEHLEREIALKIDAIDAERHKKEAVI